jgi:hypothetical protein
MYDCQLLHRYKQAVPENVTTHTFYHLVKKKKSVCQMTKSRGIHYVNGYLYYLLHHQQSLNSYRTECMYININLSDNINK